MHLLPKDCTIADVTEADTETIYYSFHSKYAEYYSTEVYMEMAAQLTLRGL